MFVLGGVVFTVQSVWICAGIFFSVLLRACCHFFPGNILVFLFVVFFPGNIKHLPSASSLQGQLRSRIFSTKNIGQMTNAMENREKKNDLKVLHCSRIIYSLGPGFKEIPTCIRLVSGRMLTCLKRGLIEIGPSSTHQECLKTSPP